MRRRSKKKTTKLQTFCIYNSVCVYVKKGGGVRKISIYKAKSGWRGFLSLFHRKNIKSCVVLVVVLFNTFSLSHAWLRSCTVVSLFSRFYMCVCDSLFRSKDFFLIATSQTKIKIIFVIFFHSFPFILVPIATIQIISVKKKLNWE